MIMPTNEVSVPRTSPNSTPQAVLTMLEGPAKGEKRKADYATLKVVGEPPVKKLFAAAAAPAASTVAPATPLSPLMVSPTNPDELCASLFGNLSMIG